MSSESDDSLHLDARLQAHEHLLKHLIVTVIAGTPDPLETFEGFQRRLTAPLKRKPVQDSANSDAEQTDFQVKEVVDWIAKGIREDLVRALGQIAGRRK